MIYGETTLMLLIAGLGLALGSFLNVVICRLPDGWRKFFGSVFSRCPACREKIRWHDNIPLLGFLLLKGRCRSCGVKISPQYPLVEGAMACLTLFIYREYGLGLYFYKYLVLSFVLLAAAVIDFQTRRVPNELIFSGMAAGIVFAFLCPFPGWRSSLTGLGLGAALPLLLVTAYEMIRGKTVMGGGDIKLMAMIGVFLGWQRLGPMIFYSSLAGLVWAAAQRLAGGGKKTPFAPGLALGSFFILLAPERLLPFF